MADVFITYAPAEAEFALRLAKGLERAGLSVTRGVTQFTPDWAVRVFDALDASSAVVALWSRDALGRDWVATESAIAAHFGQLVAVRVDPSLPRDQIPERYRGAEVIDIFEGDIAPNGWSQASNEALDRALAPLAVRLREVKSRGPVAMPIAAPPGTLSADEAAERLSAHFTFTRPDAATRDGAEGAAANREASFKAAFQSLWAIDFPPDIRAGLADFAEPSTARVGLARLYAEALSRNDREFWEQLGRLAPPLSPTLSLAAMQRAAAGGSIIAALLNPRDVRDLFAERFKTARARGAGGVVLWPMAMVAVGLIALVAAPQVTKVFQPAKQPNTEGELAKGAARQTPPAAPKAPAAELPPTDLSPTDITASDAGVAPPASRAATKAGPLTTPPEAAPPPSRATVRAGPLETPAAPQVRQASVAPGTRAGSPPSLDATAPLTRLRLCRGKPRGEESLIEVLASENMLDVAVRSALGANGAPLIMDRNEDCLNGRSLALPNGRTLSGADLLFPGDRLVVPFAPAVTTASTPAAPTTPPAEPSGQSQPATRPENAGSGQ